jgi:hypothetical protein
MILGVTADHLSGRLHVHHHDITSQAFQELEVSVQLLICITQKLLKLKNVLRPIEVKRNEV